MGSVCTVVEVQGISYYYNGINMLTSVCIFFTDFDEIWSYTTDFLKKSTAGNTKIRPVGTALIHGGPTDERSGMTKLIGAFRCLLERTYKLKLWRHSSVPLIALQSGPD
jgi:hypothetical protein